MRTSYGQMKTGYLIWLNLKHVPSENLIKEETIFGIDMWQMTERKAEEDL